MGRLYIKQTYLTMTISELRETLNLHNQSDQFDSHLTPLIRWIKEHADAGLPPFHRSFITVAFVKRNLPPNIKASHSSIAKAFKFLEYKYAGRFQFHGRGYIKIWLPRVIVDESGEDQRLRWTHREWEDYIKEGDQIYPKRAIAAPKPKLKIQHYEPPVVGRKATLEEKLKWFNTPEQVEKRKKRDSHRRKANSTKAKEKSTATNKPKPSPKPYIPSPANFNFDLDKRYWTLKMQIIRLQHKNKPVPPALQYELNNLQIKKDNNSKGKANETNPFQNL
jgi:hypothetical protein